MKEAVEELIVFGCVGVCWLRWWWWGRIRYFRWRRRMSRNRSSDPAMHPSSFTCRSSSFHLIPAAAAAASIPLHRCSIGSIKSTAPQNKTTNKHQPKKLKESVKILFKNPLESPRMAKKSLESQRIFQNPFENPWNLKESFKILQNSVLKSSRIAENGQKILKISKNSLKFLKKIQRISKNLAKSFTKS